MDTIIKNFINSKDNKKIKDLKRIRDDKSFRKEKSLFFIEGEKIFFEAPKNSIMSIFISNSKYLELEKDNKFFLVLLNYIKDYTNENIYVVADNIFDSCKDTVNSQGIICICKMKERYELEKYLDGKDFIIILNNINDPGNLGTIIRTSEAFGATLIICDKKCVDLYSPKVIRASMGSIFRKDIYISDDIIKDIQFLKSQNLKIYATLLESNKNYIDEKYEMPLAFIFGNEANGIDEDVIDIVDEKIKINMEGEIESLNVAMALGIIGFEIRRKISYAK